MSLNIPVTFLVLAVVQFLNSWL